MELQFMIMWGRDRKIFREFHGKIMLFGEYSIMEGSPAALIPYIQGSARLTLPLHEPDPEALQSNHTLQLLAGYLRQNYEKKTSINLEEIEKDIESGLYMESNIPQNKGLGSSGAICAALFDAYKPTDYIKFDYSELRTMLASIESYFHGTSSGVDPLCIYLNEPVIIQKDGYYLPGNNWLTRNNAVQLFLMDTGKDSRTKPLVQHFRDLMKQDEFAKKFSQQYIPIVEQAVHQWKNGELQEETVFALSESQLEFLGAMIPENILNIWHYGISGKRFALKLCGSGGGGMVLGFTDNLETTETCLREIFGIEIHRV